jgi:hypothetical protein
MIGRTHMIPALLSAIASAHAIEVYCQSRTPLY